LRRRRRAAIRALPESRAVLTIYTQTDGQAARAESELDPAWLAPDSRVVVWVDLDAPTAEEGRILSDVFGFHDLAVEDALEASHFPKIDDYGAYLHVILHGIAAAQQPPASKFTTHDIDFFLGRNYLVTVHSGHSRSLARLQGLCVRNEMVLSEGPVGLMHRLVDGLVDNYTPEVEALEDRLEALEVFESADHHIVRHILGLKRDIGTLRRVITPQRDAISRLARREYPIVTEALAYRFRDVYDHLVRIADEAAIMHDRVTTVLDAHLSFVSNRMNEIMKVLTIFATIFGPLTVLTGLYGMNVRLPMLPGGEASQFWLIIGAMVLSTGGMLWYFRRRGWL
jgi:magnesium transporter